jgi:hypothetical protein
LTALQLYNFTTGQLLKLFKFFRGHEITIVSPHQEKKPIPGVTEIINESQSEQLAVALSTALLSETAESSDFPVAKLVQITIEDNRRGEIF